MGGAESVTGLLDFPACTGVRGIRVYTKQRIDLEMGF